jgi:hypothetical protein
MSSRFNVEPLESFRLSRCQLPTSCIFCDHDNVVDAQRCCYCFAPLALTRSVAPNSGHVGPQPKLLTTLGPEGSGKTVFLGMLLDLLSRQRERTEFTACDSSSIAIQQETVAALAQGDFPPQTDQDPERWRWAHCRINRRTRKEPHEIFMTDVAGRTLIGELERPSCYPIFKGLFLRSFGVFLCVDAGEVNRGEKNEEFFAMRIVNHLNDVRERDVVDQALKTTPKKLRTKNVPQHVPPIAVILTKADEVEVAFDDPTAFARTRMPNLWELCQSLANPMEFFAASAVGRCGMRRNSSGRRVLVPLRVEPRGIIEPFRWMLGQPCAV